MALLEIERLRKAYRGPDGTRQLVIDVPTFQLEAGSQLALTGESGSGKTTFLYLIAGLLTPDEGVVRLDGQDMASLNEGARDRLRATTIGYIFQTFNLLQGHTCLENVLLGMSFGPGPNRDLAGEWLRRVGLGDRLRHYPRQLSTGQQQRVAVARALANRPRLVLADEPTGNLDWRTAREATALIRQTCTEIGAALLLVSHDRELLRGFETVQSLENINRAALPGDTTTEEGRA
jgi:ABC-type lipoprotein export system ATPase subunit